MSEFILNIFEFRVTRLGERVSKALKFKDAGLDSIKLVDDLLMDMKNKVTPVSIRRKTGWADTSQAIYLVEPTKDVSKGIFYGGVEVGSHGAFHRLRRRNGSEPYVLQGDDLSMRDYFFRLEIPPDTSLGFLVVQRLGRNTAGPALQQALRKKFYTADHTAHFRLVTDDKAFDEYLDGRVTAVKAQYIPHKEDNRDTVKNSTVLGSGLSSKAKEDAVIKMKVSRPITTVLKGQIKKWLTTADEAKRPKIVTLPVSDDPDKVILCIETDDGRQKQLHPGMIEDMALTIDLTAKVTRGAKGGVNLASANAATTELCASHRAALTAPTK